MQLTPFILSLLVIPFLQACGPGVRGDAYRVGGLISGLTGGGEVYLRNGAEDLLQVTANGEFYFEGVLNTGDTYSVSIVSVPSTQSCSLQNSSGSIGKNDIENVRVECADLRGEYGKPAMSGVTG